MNKFLVGLLVLGSFSTFANDKCEVRCVEESGKSVLLHISKAFLSLDTYGPSREVYARVCTIEDENGNTFYKNKVQGMEIVGVNRYGQTHKIDRDEAKKQSKFKTQNTKITKKLEECIND